MSRPPFDSRDNLFVKLSDNRRVLVEAELVASVAWLIKLRWIAGIGVIVATWVMGAIFKLEAAELELYLIGASILAYNLIFFVLEKRCSRESAPDSSFRRLAIWQAGMDWLAMSMLIHYSGGIESPALLFFIFHIIIAAIFFPPLTAFGFAFLAIGMLSGIAMLEYFSIISHRPIVGLLDTPFYQNGLYVATLLMFFTSMCLITTYLGSSIQERIRRREEEIVVLSERLQRATARLQAINEGARTVGSTLELPEVLNRLVKTTAEAMAVKACSIRLLDKSGQILEPVAVYGLSQAYLDKGPVDPLTNPLAREVLAGKIVNIPDVVQSPKIQYPEEARQEGIRSVLSAPLIGKEGPIGILRAYAVEVNRFKPEDEEFLAAIAAQGSIAIENALAYQAIESLDTAKSKFIRIVTHELRSPVSVTRSLMRTLMTGYAGEVSALQLDLLNRAVRRLEFLQRLIDDLIDLAAGKTDARAHERSERIDLKQALSRVLRRFEVVAEEKGLSLEYSDQASESDIFVLATPDGLDRIFDNLLSNAVKYTPSGGRVTVTVRREDNEVEISVDDTGIGIPKEVIGHLFKEFYRAPNAKAVEHEGTGLGLTIARDNIMRFGGRISVQSEVDQGACFTVSLPMIVDQDKSIDKPPTVSVLRASRPEEDPPDGEGIDRKG